MEQHELFAEAPVPAWQPDPEKVRNRLRRILAEARSAETMPWDQTRLSLYRTIFPDMTKWLPVDEADGWQMQFHEELARLGAE